MKKKMCNRVLAMLLTLVTLLTVLPVSAFADAWLDVNAENKQNGNVSSSDVTITVSAQSLLDYIKNKDLQGLIDGISVNGLKGIFSKDELYEIIPKERFQAIVDAVKEDITPELLMEYIDISALLSGIEKSKLIDLVKGIDDLQSYVKDYNALMQYIDEDAIAAAVDLIDTDKLVADYATDLAELALALSPNELAKIVDLNAAIHLEGVDFAAAINKAYIETTITYEVLFEQYVNEDALHDFIVEHYNDERWSIDHLHAYVNENAVESLLHDDAHKDALPSYVHKPRLQLLIQNKNIDYATLKAKNLLSETALINAFETNGYASFEAYLDEAAAQEIMKDVFPVETYLLYWENGALNLEKLFEEETIPTGVYEALLKKAVDLNALLFNDASAYNVTKLIEQNILNVADMIGADALFTIDELETAGVVDYKEILFGAPERNLDALLSVEDLLNNNVFNRKEMLEGVPGHAPLFTLGEMITEGIVSIDAMIGAGHSYDQLADIAELERQLLDLMHNDRLTASQITNCLKKDANNNIDYATAIEAIGGVEKVVEETTLTYQKILTEYVTDFDALMQELGLESIIEAIVSGGKLQTIFNVSGLIDAIGMDKLLELVDVKVIVEELYNNGGFKAILGALTPDKYIRCLNDIINVLAKNVQEIKINGVVITEKPVASLLFINSEQLLAAIQTVVPTLEDLSKVGADGKLFSFSLSITYASAATNGVSKTKELNLNVVLDGGADKISAAAKKLQSLLDRFLSYSYNNGNLTVQVELPAEFARAIKKVLEELGNDADPELVALKDELLALYDANLSDVSNFFNNITVHQIATILDKVDPAVFGKAYNKVMSSKYVETVLDLVEKLTKVDLSDVTPEEILNKLANVSVPTVEQIVEKVEEITGRDLNSVYNKIVTQKYVAKALDLLAEKTGVDLSDVTPDLIIENWTEIPNHPTVDKIVAKVEELTGREISSKIPSTEEIENALAKVEGALIVDLFTELAAKKGYDVDLQKILKDAAASEDPFAHLYTTFVDAVENSEALYNALKSRVMKVIDRLLASSIGEKLDTLQVAEFYLGNGVFGYDKSITFSPKKVLDKAVDKLIEFVLSKRDFDTKYIDDIRSMVSGMIKDTTVNVGIDTSVVVKGLYEASFYDENGALIDKTFLPAGTDLLLMKDYAPVNPIDKLNGWKDAHTNVVYKDMPAKDVQLIPDLDDGMADVVILNPKDMSVAGVIKLPAGETLEAYESEMLEILKSKTALKNTDTVQWFVVENGAITNTEWLLDQAVNEDMVLTWAIVPTTFTVTVVHPETGDVLDTLTVPYGDNLLAFEDRLNELAGATDEKTPDWHLVVNGVASEETYSLATPVESDITLTWSYPAVPPTTHTVIVLDPETMQQVGDTIVVNDGDNLLAFEALLNELAGATDEKKPYWHLVENGVASTEKYNLATAITGDLYLTWSYPVVPPTTHTVTVLDPETMQVEGTFTVNDGDNLLAFETLLNELAGATDEKKPFWHLVENGVASTEKYNLATAVTTDLFLTWSYPTVPPTTHTVTLVDPTFGFVKSFEVVAGETLEQFREELETLAGATNEKKPAWYIVENGALAEKFSLDTAINSDLTITWKYFKVTVVNPETLAPLGTFELGIDQTLADYKDAMELLAGAAEKGLTPAWYAIVNNALDRNAKWNFTTPVNADLTLTWKYYTVTLVDPDNKLLDSFDFGDGDSLNEILAILEGYAGARDGFKPAWFTVVDAARDVRINLAADILWDMTITWHYPVITVQVYERDVTDEIVGTEYYTVGINTILGNFMELHTSDFQSYVDHMPEHLQWIFDSFHVEWGTDLGVDYSVQDDIVINVEIVKDYENANVQLDGKNYGEHYDFKFEDGILHIVQDEWADEVELSLGLSLIQKLANQSYGFTMETGDSSDYYVHFDANLVKALATRLQTAFDANGVEYVDFKFNEGRTDSFDGPAFAANSGAVYFSVSFVFGDVVDGDFFNDIGGVATIRVPFAGKNVTGVEKTFVYINGEEVTNLGLDENWITFTTTHFSDIVVVNKYWLSYANSHLWDAAMLQQFPNALPELLEQLVNTFPIAEGWYAAGEELTHGNMDWKSQFNGLALLYTKIVGANTEYHEGDTIVMPAGAVQLQHTVTAKVYYIYFYVDGKCDSYIDYTKFSTDIPTWDAVRGHQPTTAVSGTWAWSGINDALDLAADPQDVYLFLVPDVAEKTFTMTFTLKDADGNVIATATLTASVSEWLGSKLATLGEDVLAQLGDLNDPTKAIVWMNGDKALTAYTLEEWATLFASDATSVAFEATYTNRQYTVYTDGNVTLDITGNSAIAGTVITVTPLDKVGMDATVTVMINGNKVELTDGKFTMQAADAYITVTYTLKTLAYVGVDGNEVKAPYGTQILYTVTIPAGYTLMQDITALENAPKGMALIASALNDKGELVLTYAFTLNAETNGADLKAFDAKVQAIVSALIYQKIYILNGKQYATEADALANLPEGMVLKEWKQGEYKNLFFAVLEPAEADNTVSLIILIVVLVLLVLILLIALFYTLYICGKLKPNWFLKGVTAIVSGFFAVCMAVAAAGLAIARFFGYQEEDIMEETIDLNSDEEDMSAYANAEEATEEATEEAVEETVEEATEAEVEVTADAENAEVELNVSADTEDAIEVTEEVAEEATEEVTEEATEEVTEEATEETVEEAVAEETDEVAEAVAETVDELVAEVTAEEATEEATEEAAEEATEEASEDATKKDETNE